MPGSHLCNLRKSLGSGGGLFLRLVWTPLIVVPNTGDSLDKKETSSIWRRIVFEEVTSPILTQIRTSVNAKQA